jgi:hypothetical protein
MYASNANVKRQVWMGSDYNFLECYPIPGGYEILGFNRIYKGADGFTWELLAEVNAVEKRGQALVVPTRDTTAFDEWWAGGCVGDIPPWGEETPAKYPFDPITHTGEAVPEDEWPSFTTPGGRLIKYNPRDMDNPLTGPGSQWNTETGEWEYVEQAIYGYASAWVCNGKKISSNDIWTLIEIEAILSPAVEDGMYYTRMRVRESINPFNPDDVGNIEIAEQRAYAIETQWTTFPDSWFEDKVFGDDVTGNWPYDVYVNATLEQAKQQSWNEAQNWFSKLDRISQAPEGGWFSPKIESDEMTLLEMFSLIKMKGMPLSFDPVELAKCETWIDAYKHINDYGKPPPMPGAPEMPVMFNELTMAIQEYFMMDLGMNPTKIVLYDWDADEATSLMSIGPYSPFNTNSSIVWYWHVHDDGPGGPGGPGMEMEMPYNLFMFLEEKLLDNDIHISDQLENCTKWGDLIAFTTYGSLRDLLADLEAAIRMDHGMIGDITRIEVIDSFSMGEGGTPFTAVNENTPFDIHVQIMVWIQMGGGGGGFPTGPGEGPGKEPEGPRTMWRRF